MDRRTVLALILSLLIFIGWQKYYIEPRLPKPVQTPVSQSTAPAPQQALPSDSKIAPASPAVSKPPVIRDLPVGTGVAKISNGTKVFSAWDLKAFKLDLAPEAAAVDMKSVTRQDGEVQLAFDDQTAKVLSYLTTVRGDLHDIPNGLRWTYEDENVRIVRDTTALPDQAYVNLAYRVSFKTIQPKYAYVSIAGETWEDDPEAADRRVLYWADDSLEYEALKEIEGKNIMTPIKWVAVASRYFLMGILSETGEPLGQILPTGTHSARVSLVYPVKGDTLDLSLRAFFGPKDIEIVQTVDKSFEHAVDFGFFTVIAYPLLKLMKWFYALFHNWGISIILLTIMVKILTYPLTYKSMKSMKQMAKLQPQLAKIREKYKDDKEALNREMLTLMRTHGYNPAAGCLPILIQMPVFFALYQVLYSSVELYHAPFALWIQDLSSKDPYFVTPVLLSVTMWIQQKLTPQTATDPMQAKMLQLMPLIFGVFMLTLPSGLTLYMLINAITSIFQQMILNKKFDTGNATGTPARA